MSHTSWKEIYQADLIATGLANTRWIMRVRDRRFKFYKREHYKNNRHDFLGCVIAKFLRW